MSRAMRLREGGRRGQDLHMAWAWSGPRRAAVVVSGAARPPAPELAADGRPAGFLIGDHVQAGPALERVRRRLLAEGRR